MNREKTPKNSIYEIKILTHPTFQIMQDFKLMDLDIPDQISYLFIGTELKTDTPKNSNGPISIRWQDMKQIIIENSKDKESEWIDTFEKEHNLEVGGTFSLSSIFAKYINEEVQ